eukprot:jgi/Botrbrau1/17332/Bobra.0015s0078.1
MISSSRGVSNRISGRFLFHEIRQRKHFQQYRRAFAIAPEWWIGPSLILFKYGQGHGNLCILPSEAPHRGTLWTTVVGMDGRNLEDDRNAHQVAGDGGCGALGSSDGTGSSRTSGTGISACRSSPPRDRRKSSFPLTIQDVGSTFGVQHWHAQTQFMEAIRQLHILDETLNQLAALQLLQQDAQAIPGAGFGLRRLWPCSWRSFAFRSSAPRGCWQR